MGIVRQWRLQRTHRHRLCAGFLHTQLLRGPEGRWLDQRVGQLFGREFQGRTGKHGHRLHHHLQQCRRLCGHQNRRQCHRLGQQPRRWHQRACRHRLGGNHQLGHGVCRPQNRWQPLFMGLLAHRRYRRTQRQLPHGAVAHLGEALFPPGRRRPGEPQRQPDAAIAAVPGHPGRGPHLHDHQRQASRWPNPRCRHRLDLRQPRRARHLPPHD